jgi:hypothetical protein
VDTLRVAVTKDHAPWYKQVPIIVSVIALLFSFGTTYVAYKKAEIEDIRNSRTELRGLLQRLSELPIENVDYGATYAQDPTRKQIVAGILTQENSILSQQAAEIALSLPPGYISAAEHYALAVGLSNSYDLDTALVFFSNAANMSNNLNIAGASLRGAANLLFAHNNIQAGRERYRDALELSEKLASKTDYEKAYNRILTLTAWSISEASTGNTKKAAKLLDEAETLLMSNDPSMTGLRAEYGPQILIMRQNLEANLPLQLPKNF